MAQKGMKPSAMIKQRMKGTPVPMPKKDMKRGNPVAMPKKSKPKGLNDFLKQGVKPPSKNKKGIPSDADVIIKGYNDKKTLGRKKK